MIVARVEDVERLLDERVIKTKAGRGELYRQALDTIAADYAGDEEVRYRSIGDLYGSEFARGGGDLAIRTGTLVAVAVR